ncbi:zinc finger protein 32-like [Pseudoliparis swirei]|uniref:zinc finger protein 32-like n=1 Tax=Pseudoliparis swirei TaxID=2059687 RepID=UPI0024BEB8B8|nr:zinc finger protein 32-like [Pseudoliparis swirei]
MSKVQMLRCFVNQRLTAAAQEICGLFERTIAEYEEELCSSQEENERHRKRLDADINSHIRLQRADVQQLLEVQEEVPLEQQDWSTSLEQDEPDPPHIKEEQEELWTNQEGEQLQGLAEAGIRFSFSPVKSEDDEEEAQSSHLHQRLTEHMETEADGEDYGGPEPDRKSGPDTDEKTGDSTEPDTDDSVDWKETREPQSGLNSLNNEDVHVSDSKCSSGEKPLICSECGKRFHLMGDLKKHMRIHTGEKTFKCSVCDKIFKRKSRLKRHMLTHTGEKPFNCLFCDKSFKRKSSVKRHMLIHTGEKPFSCSECDRGFAYRHHLKIHMLRHTGEKPFSCSQCGKSFTLSGDLKKHMKVHTGEKPFSCSECDRGFAYRHHLKIHMLRHTGEKPFSCSQCGKPYTRRVDLKRHMLTHTGDSL